MLLVDLFDPSPNAKELETPLRQLITAIQMMAVRHVSDGRHAMLARAREARQDKPRKIRKGQ